MIINDSNNIKYGDFVVMKAKEAENFLCWQSTDGTMSYGVFRIDKQKHGYVKDVEKPIKAYKIHLTPVGNINYVDWDWYSCMLSQSDIETGRIVVFDNFNEAIQWANDLNNIKTCK